MVFVYVLFFVGKGKRNCKVLFLGGWFESVCLFFGCSFVLVFGDCVFDVVIWILGGGVVVGSEFCVRVFGCGLWWKCRVRGGC